MRNAFIRGLTEAAARDERIVFLTADLGYKLFDDFARRFPGRFVNVGVAEATMIGAACGLALDGFRPFVYSIATFATLRCYEQIRDDLCYHDVDVTVVGVGGGFSYGQNGPTHHALEDVAALRALPNMKVVCPGDPAEAEAAVAALARMRGPSYLRLGRAGEPRVHAGPVVLEPPSSIELRGGDQVALLATGSSLESAVAAADLLRAKGVRAACWSMPWVKPLDAATVERVARSTPLVATIEEHSVLGGFGGAVSELVASLGAGTRLIRFGAPDRFAPACGDQAYLRAESGLSPDAIAARIQRELGGT